MLYTKAAFASGVVMLLGFTCFNELTFENRWRWMSRLELLLGALALVWTLIFGEPTAFYIYAFVLVSTMVPGMTWTRKKDAESTMLTLGFFVVGATGIAQILNGLGWFGRPDLEIYPYGMLFLFLSISISLARNTWRPPTWSSSNNWSRSGSCPRRPSSRSSSLDGERSSAACSRSTTPGRPKSSKKPASSSSPSSPRERPRIPGVEVSLHDATGDRGRWRLL